MNLQLYTRCCSRGYRYLLIACKILKERGIEYKIDKIIRVDPKKEDYYGIKTELIIYKPYILIDNNNMIEANKIKEYLDGYGTTTK